MSSATVKDTIELFINSVKNVITKKENNEGMISKEDLEDALFDIDTVKDLMKDLTSNKEKKKYSDELKQLEKLLK